MIPPGTLISLASTIWHGCSLCSAPMLSWYSNMAAGVFSDSSFSTPSLVPDM